MTSTLYPVTPDRPAATKRGTSRQAMPHPRCTVSTTQKMAPEIRKRITSTSAGGRSLTNERTATGVDPQISAVSVSANSARLRLTTANTGRSAPAEASVDVVPSSPTASPTRPEYASGEAHLSSSQATLMVHTVMAAIAAMTVIWQPVPWYCVRSTSAVVNHWLLASVFPLARHGPMLGPGLILPNSVQGGLPCEV